MLDAFRTIPTSIEQLVHAQVAERDPDTQTLYFSQLYAAPFGFESTVYAFAHWSAFLEACGRRIGQLLWATYTDDRNLVDAAQAQGQGQALLNDIFKYLGAPLSDA